MQPRTNFDVIDIRDNSIFLKSRCKDCFGDYTTNGHLIGQFRNHKVFYYLPDFFVTTKRWGDDRNSMTKLNSEYKDKLIFNDEEIETYLTWLRELGVNVKRVDDTFHTIISSFDAPIDPELPKKVRCKTLEFDFTECRNIKQVKFQLFLTRYLIDGYGNQILLKTMQLYKENPDMDKWDLFLMNEFTNRFIYEKSSKNIFYIIFGEDFIFRYFSINDFINNVILKDLSNFYISQTYYDNKFMPYYDNKINDNDNEKTRIAKIKLKEAYNNLSTKEFLEYWKNFNW